MLKDGRKDGSTLFNEQQHILYGVGNMVKDYQKNIFYMHHPTGRISHTTALVCGALVGTRNSSMGPSGGIDLLSYAPLFYLAGRKCFFNDARNTFCLLLYGFRHMVKDHQDSERGNPLPQNGIVFPIRSKGSFIYIIP